MLRLNGIFELCISSVLTSCWVGFQTSQQQNELLPFLPDLPIFFSSHIFTSFRAFHILLMKKRPCSFPPGSHIRSLPAGEDHDAETNGISAIVVNHLQQVGWVAQAFAHLSSNLIPNDTGEVNFTERLLLFVFKSCHDHPTPRRK